MIGMKLTQILFYGYWDNTQCLEVGRVMIVLRDSWTVWLWTLLIPIFLKMHFNRFIVRSFRPSWEERNSINTYFVVFFFIVFFAALSVFNPFRACKVKFVLFLAINCRKGLFLNCIGGIIYHCVQAVCYI